MASLIYLDTNVVLWLAGAREQLSEGAVRHINEAPLLLICPMVELEIEYLHEIGRIQEPASVVLEHLRGGLNLRHCDRGFAAVAAVARTIKWTRDPFDRLITAQAMIGDDVLLTRDKIIRANYARATW
ncbi:MAG: PIN domain-containing protein [Polyangia bacterium]|jgi:PIN domain nuclease of toxin-antitoxin system|nr:PIN domain-containing protein [Polyangia bacterium]